MQLLKMQLSVNEMTPQEEKCSQVILRLAVKV